MEQAAVIDQRLVFSIALKIDRDRGEAEGLTQFTLGAQFTPLQADDPAPCHYGNLSLVLPEGGSLDMAENRNDRSILGWRQLRELSFAESSKRLTIT
jgi:hypothetical protein